MRKWFEIIRELKEGDVVEIPADVVRDVFMASKGDVAVATRGHLFILISTPYSELAKVLEKLPSTARRVDSRIVCEIVKAVPERKFSLCRPRELTLMYEYTRSYSDYVVERENQRYEVEGAEIVLAEGIERRWQERGMLVVSWDGRGFAARTENVERVKVGEERKRTVTWQIVDPQKPLGRFLQRNQELLRTRPSAVDALMKMFANDIIVSVRARSDGLRVDAQPINLPSDEELLECSRFYSVIVPRWYVSEYSGARAKQVLAIDVFYKGMKKTVMLNYVPPKLLFRCLRHRYSITAYAKRKLPRGIPYVETSITMPSIFESDVEKINEWTRIVREEILPKVRNLRSEPRKVDPLTAFLELWYINTPKRKIENVVKPWIELFEKVKHLAPKATLYITFYGQRDVLRRRQLPNYMGFRVDKDGFVTLMPARYVPVSGITMKGGDFERLYREAYVKKLFEYQIVTKEEKLRILAGDVEEVRRMLRSSGVEPATAKFEEVREKLQTLAKSHDNDNIVLLAIKHFEDMKSFLNRSKIQVNPENLLTMLVGLVKTGRYPEDYRRFAELGGLEYLRMVVKYVMKSKGYSIRKGVMFLGSPDEVRRRILEVVKGLRGRLLALFEEVGEAVEEIAVVDSLKRVEALLEF